VDYPLASRLPPRGAPVDPDDLLNRFLDYVALKNLELYPAQEEAILEIMAGKNVLLNTPTGSGKSLVALAMHFKSVAEGKRSFYTCPIKALVSEKFFALCAEFGPENVGMMTGDAVVNRDALIVCCTAEILANHALRHGEFGRVHHLIIDEFHYYSDRERGSAWQVPLLTLPWTTFLLMSATIGNPEFFQQKLQELTGVETAIVRSSQRPVPLEYEYRETPLHETVHHYILQNRAPIYIVNFTQRSAAEEAQNLMSIDLCTRDEKKAIAEELRGARFDSPYGKDLRRFLAHGVGLHHAGLLPRYRLLVEKLAQRGLLKIICGTDTLGVGINIPIRTVLFTKLCKFDGEKVGILSVRDFKQISGRAGRKGFDSKGFVAVQAPEHVIENIRLDQKVALDPSKKKKIVRKRPPERGYAHWDRATFERLTTAQPEPLVSRFQISHGMLLNTLSRPRGCQAMKQLIKGCHEPPGNRRALKKQALLLFRSLVEAKIVELLPRSEGGPLRVNADLQKDFSLNQTLALFLVEVVTRLDQTSPTYAVDVLSLAEAIIENPEQILMRQVDRLKREKLAELKAAGVDYEDRMAELEKIDYPKPNAELIYNTFNEFAKEHPWIAQENIRPKSIAREMHEQFYSFSGYIKDYELQRSEGLLLRYLTDVYKVLLQTIPVGLRTPELDDIITYLGAIVRGTDSSLLDEWERLRNPEYFAAAALEPELRDAAESHDITRDTRSFLVLLRNALFQVLRALAHRNYAEVCELVAEGPDPWTPERIELAIRDFYTERQQIRLDPAARSPAFTTLEADPERPVWHIRQVICDDQGFNDWFLEGEVDFDRSREAGRPVISLLRIGGDRIGEGPVGEGAEGVGG
jgi:superfamily II RNA helicase